MSWGNHMIDGDDGAHWASPYSPPRWEAQEEPPEEAKAQQVTAITGWPCRVGHDGLLEAKTSGVITDEELLELTQKGVRYSIRAKGDIITIIMHHDEETQGLGTNGQRRPDGDGRRADGFCHPEPIRGGALLAPRATSGAPMGELHAQELCGNQFQTP